MLRKIRLIPNKIRTVLIERHLDKHSGMITYCHSFHDYRALEIIRNVRAERDLMLEDLEALSLIKLVEDTANIKGDIAEVGVFEGASAKLICEYKKNNKDLLLFDTFIGLPELGKNDDKSQFKKGDFKCNYLDVKKYLKSYKNIFMFKGLFQTAPTWIDIFKFSLVHLDVDLYETTKFCLEFFYDRMTPGGIILSHDYTNTAGVKKAFDEFIKDKEESIIRLAVSQCMIVKR